MSLLTLNETTLFYYFLSDRTSNDKEKFDTGINDWAAAIPDNASTKVAPTSALGRISKSSNHHASGSHLPALTNTTSRSSSSASVLSKSIKISQNIKVKAERPSHDTSIEIMELGLQDDDETMGVEREAALKSPPKGKTRVSSAVSKKFPPPLTAST
jgi:hypothetical protein